MQERPTPHLLEPSELRRLGEFFLDCGYTEKGLAELFGDFFPPGTPPTKVALLLEDGDQPAPLATLVRLFRLQQPVDREEVRDLLPGWVLDTCLQSHLLTEQESALQSFFRIDPAGRVLLISDSNTDGPLEHDFVSGSNPYAVRLLNLTPRLPVQDALDAFCGGGIQALHLAAHCRNVTATELNPRAVAFAEFNAVLNGISKIRWLQGDRFVPVQGRLFDLIVANPPFFIGPALTHLYRDNEMKLDSFCCDVVRQGAKHLKPGGFLLCLAEWVDLEGHDWRDRLRGWFEGIGCDTWVLTTYRRDPAPYAKRRLLEVIDPKQPESKRALQNRIDHLRREGVIGILGGIIFLRRSMAENWIEIDDYPVQITGPCGEEILKAFGRRDFLAEHPNDEQLLQSQLAVSQAVRLEQTHRFENGSVEPGPQRLHLDNGIKYQAKVNDKIIRLLQRCDGGTPLIDVLKSLGETQPSADDKHPALLDTTRRLIQRGVLDPVPEDSHLTF